MTRPLVPVPNVDLDEIARQLLEGTYAPVRAPANIQDPQNYIILESTTQHPDLLISMHRLSYTPEVEKAAKSLKLALQNTAEEKDGHKYIGNIQHQQALDITKALQ